MHLFPAIQNLLAQAPPPNPDGDVGGLFWFWSFFFGGGSLLYAAFWIWMAIWCVRNDPEWRVWLWIILIFHPVGALIYFLARWLPGANIPAPDFTQKFLRKGEVRRLEIAARQIGNAHQFIELGDALRETGQFERASAAYQDALAKDGENPQALWGAGWIHFRQEDYQAAHERLAKLVALDPTYKFGDVSLLHGKALIAIGQRDEACDHLERHIKRWRHPEALYVLAQLYFSEDDFEAASGHLQALIMDVDSSPKAIARKQMSWKSRAQKLLKRIPA